MGRGKRLLSDIAAFLSDEDVLELVSADGCPFL